MAPKNPNLSSQQFRDQGKSYHFRLGYEHAKGGSSYEGYGGRQKAIDYGAGYKEGAVAHSTRMPNSLSKPCKDFSQTRSVGYSGFCEKCGWHKGKHKK